ncbi:hypothetical protein CRUP_028962 [Coryphaenoides rupestris]|nr:hypothetical protein CRUP_028962 [Coryphaenoides rupestris]
MASRLNTEAARAMKVVPSRINHWTGSRSKKEPASRSEKARLPMKKNMAEWNFLLRNTAMRTSRFSRMMMLHKTTMTTLSVLRSFFCCFRRSSSSSLRFLRLRMAPGGGRAWRRRGKRSSAPWGGGGSGRGPGGRPRPQEAELGPQAAREAELSSHLMTLDGLKRRMVGHGGHMVGHRGHMVGHRGHMVGHRGHMISSSSSSQIERDSSSLSQRTGKEERAEGSFSVSYTFNFLLAEFVFSNRRLQILASSHAVLNSTLGSCYPALFSAGEGVTAGCHGRVSRES